MIYLELTKEEQDTLREALEGHLSDLQAEIADTDDRAFRNMLKNRQEILAKVLAALQQTPTPSREQALFVR